jgi:hypothetical protein
MLNPPNRNDENPLKNIIKSGIIRQPMPKDNFKIKIDKDDLKIRKRFSRDPSEKIELPRKGAPYSRAQTKSEIQKQLEEEEADNQDLDFNY